jgi:integrase
MACFDVAEFTVNQDRRLGVKTKAGKVITTRLFPFHEKLLEYVLDWVAYLAKTKCFEPGHPLFPRTKVEQAEGGLSFVASEVEPVFWSGGNSIREILKRRSEQAGLEYYNPHAFRHAAVHVASQYCVTPEQFKAVSQNLGHEHVATTLKTYGMLDDHRVGDVLSTIDFTSKPGQDSSSIPASELEAFLRKFKQRA